MAIVAILELSNSGSNLGEVLEEAPMKDLLLQRPIEPFGNTIGLRLGDESEAWRGAPELDLVKEVLSGILRAVVHAQGQSTPYVGTGSAKHRFESLCNLLQRGKAIASFHSEDADATVIEVVCRREDPYPAIIRRLDPSATQDAQSRPD